MAFPLDAEAEAELAAGRIITADLVDFYLNGLTLRGWNWPGTLSYPANDAVDDDDSVSYVSMEGRMQVSKGLRMSASLSAEPLKIVLDGSRSGDDEDFVGQLIDSDWHQRLVRVRQILLKVSDGTTPTDPVGEWHGRLDHLQKTDRADQPSTWTATCEGGLFRVRGRRLRTRTHADQQIRAPGDMFYSATAKMVGRTFYWGKTPQQGTGKPPTLIDYIADIRNRR